MAGRRQWFDEHLRWNGAISGDWNNFQFLLCRSEQRDRGAECCLRRAPRHSSRTSNGGGERLHAISRRDFSDAKLTKDFCGTPTISNCAGQVNGTATSPIEYTTVTTFKGPYAASGTRLPGTPRLKANLVGRYNFPLFSGAWNAYTQAAVVYQDASVPLLFPSFYQNGPAGQLHLGELPPYTLVNLAAGVEKNGLAVAAAARQHLQHVR